MATNSVVSIHLYGSRAFLHPMYALLCLLLLGGCSAIGGGADHSQPSGQKASDAAVLTAGGEFSMRDYFGISFVAVPVGNHGSDIWISRTPLRRHDLANLFSANVAARLATVSALREALLDSAHREQLRLLTEEEYRAVEQFVAARGGAVAGDLLAGSPVDESDIMTFDSIVGETMSEVMVRLARF